MSRGHGIIINYETFLPFVFTYNPESVTSNKKINYFNAPNIGGSSHEKFFSGFDNREVKLELICQDFQSPTGVQQEIAYFEELSEPSPGLLGIAGSFFGNENYPPPKVLYQFGESLVPMLYDPMDVSIQKTHFHDGQVRGIVGVPKRAVISLTLSLDENSILFKSNQIAKKALAVSGSVNSLLKEARHKATGVKKDHPGIFNPALLKGK